MIDIVVFALNKLITNGLFYFFCHLVDNLLQQMKYFKTNLIVAQKHNKKLPCVVVDIIVKDTGNIAFANSLL